MKRGSYYDAAVPLPRDAVPAQTLDEARSRQDGRGPLLPVHVQRLKGFITEIFPETRTYTVVTETDHKLPAVQRLLQDPGENRILPVGCQVTLTNEYGPWIITGCLNFTHSRQADDAPQSLTGVSGTGANDALYVGKGDGNFRTEKDPRDMGPRDWAQVGRLGNAVAVLDGGVTMLKASEFAQLRAHVVNDLVELFSRNFRHITDMGFSEIKNEGGRLSMRFRGASDQLTEAGADQENWTIRMDLGHSGDLFNFELTRPDGGSLFKFHVSPDGNCLIYGENGVDIKSGQNRNETILGDNVTSIKGASSQRIAGEVLHTLESNRTTTVSSTDSRTVGNDNVEAVVRDDIRTVGGKTVHNHVGGNPATAKPGDVAYQMQIANGDYKIDIGDPAFGANPLARAGHIMKIFGGDLIKRIATKGNIEHSTKVGNILNETQKGDVKYKTGVGTAQLDGSKVALGGSGASEQLLCGNLWATWTSSLIDAVMTISVPTAVGPSGVPLNAPRFAALKAQVLARQMLSDFAFTQKVRIPS
jgi:hypothetical protein